MFRSLTCSLTKILVAEATRQLPTRELPIQTPLEEMQGRVLDGVIGVVPILRAGLGMLDSTLAMLPEAAVGYVGLERDEATAVARSYYCKLPSLRGRTALMLDPMLATGGSAARAARILYEAEARHVILLCIVAAPAGVERLAEEFPDLHVIAAALDRELDSRSYIRPGLGDFGDRLYGTAA
jgi:uracil phosphoribosyltransferase